MSRTETRLGPMLILPCIRVYCSDDEDDGVSEDLDAALRSLHAFTAKVCKQRVLHACTN